MKLSSFLLAMMTPLAALAIDPGFVTYRFAGNHWYGDLDGAGEVSGTVTYATNLAAYCEDRVVSGQVIRSTRLADDSGQAIRWTLDVNGRTIRSHVPGTINGGSIELTKSRLYDGMTSPRVDHIGLSGNTQRVPGEDGVMEYWEFTFHFMDKDLLPVKSAYEDPEIPRRLKMPSGDFPLKVEMVFRFGPWPKMGHSAPAGFTYSYLAKVPNDPSLSAVEFVDREYGPCK